MTNNSITNMYMANVPDLLTRQCTTQMFLGFCRSHRCMFLQIANKVVNVGALRCAHPHSDT